VVGQVDEPVAEGGALGAILVARALLELPHHAADVFEEGVPCRTSKTARTASSAKRSRLVIDTCDYSASTLLGGHLQGGRSVTESVA
jgi:hypothetical protein